MLEKLENALMAFLAALGLALVCTEVVLRYFFPKLLTDYGMELTIYFTVWAIFLAGAPLVRESRHVRSDIIMHLLPPSGQRIIEIVSLVVGLVFTSVLAYYGWMMVANSFSLGERSESSAHIPLYLYYMALPVGMTLMVFPFVRRLYLYIFRFDPASMRVTEDQVARDK